MNPFKEIAAFASRQWHTAVNRHLRLTARFTPLILKISKGLGVVTVVASVVCIAVILVREGYDHRPQDARLLTTLLRSCQWMFLINILFNLCFNLQRTLSETRIIKWIVDVAVLTTLFPLLYPEPTHPWIPLLGKVMYSVPYLYAVLLGYAGVDLSYGVMTMLARRTNPSLILGVSFLIIIVAGAFSLMMPKCTVGGISFVDALFISTSAVCITGLTPVDVATTFTPVGLLVISVLIQTGGLGVMTFTSFFALFFSGNTSVYSQLMVKDMIYSKSFNALIPTLLYIFGFTVAIELTGAALMFLSIHGTLGMTVEDELIFAGFHSLSAFCNAGFSNVEGGLSNPALLYHNRSIYLIVSALVLAGGIGFPILLNFKSAIWRRIRRVWRFIRRRPALPPVAHLYDLNTKVVLITTGVIFVVSTLLFFLFEYNNTLRGFSFTDKVVQSVFNSWVPRSSGFSSVNPAEFMNITVIMFAVLMWIGGASQSTAGGIKVNTFAAMLLNLRAVVRGSMTVSAFHRSISVASIRRAHAVIALSVISYIFYAMVLIALEPSLSAKALLYEAASALFTVGSSLGVTPELGSAAKCLLCTAMFLGRVGIFSLLVGLVGARPESAVRFPSDNIIIS